MVAAAGNTGIPLAPTSEYRARKLLEAKKAEVYRHEPFFAIRLLERETGGMLSAEYGSDVGYQHAGIPIKPDKHEYISEQRNMLEGEAERNRERVKKRRGRRGRLRYRECKFDNRKKKPAKGWEKWFPPSLRHRAETQLRLFEAACEVFPIRSAYKKKSVKFRDYIALKTYGLDAYSRIPYAELAAYAEQEGIAEKVAEVFEEGSRESCTAIRWAMRGLKIEDAIRKVQVDAEVSANCVGRRY